MHNLLFHVWHNIINLLAGKSCGFLPKAATELSKKQQHKNKTPTHTSVSYLAKEEEKNLLIVTL